jgi:PAS domain-containing protein
VINLVHPDDREQVRNIKSAHSPRRRTAAIRSNSVSACSWHYIHLLDRFSFTCDSTGSPRARIGSVSDISARKKVEQTILDEHKRLENIVEATHIGTWEWNIQTGDLVLNRQWVGMLGYTLAELAPISVLTWRRLIHPDDEQYVVALFGKTYPGAIAHL